MIFAQKFCFVDNNFHVLGVLYMVHADLLVSWDVVNMIPKMRSCLGDVCITDRVPLVRTHRNLYFLRFSCALKSLRAGLGSFRRQLLS